MVDKPGYYLVILTTQAQEIVQQLKVMSGQRQDYNESGPHSSLNYQTPAEFTASWRNRKLEGKQTDIIK